MKCELNFPYSHADNLDTWIRAVEDLLKVLRSGPLSAACAASCRNCGNAYLPGRVVLTGNLPLNQRIQTYRSLAGSLH